jgi:hypothetical protein
MSRVLASITVALSTVTSGSVRARTASDGINVHTKSNDNPLRRSRRMCVYKDIGAVTLCVNYVIAEGQG